MINKLIKKITIKNINDLYPNELLMYFKYNSIEIIDKIDVATINSYILLGKILTFLFVFFFRENLNYNSLFIKSFNFISSL